MRLLRRLLVPCAALALALSVATASPAAAKPAQVGSPWVKAASPTSLTLDWSPVKGAKRYQVFYATSYDGVKKSSAKSRKTSGKASELKVTGLKAGKMYCFMVRAIGNGTGSRSHRHCKFTMRSANRTSLETASVATYNVCARASGCRAWDPRLPAIRQRVLDAKADVVAFQETSGRSDDLERAMRSSGYAMAATSGTETLLYRTDRFSVATTPTGTEQVCEDEPYTGDTTGWDVEDGYHEGPEPDEYWTYDPQSQTWVGEVCRDQTVEEPHVGEWYLGNAATAAWAYLTSKRTGRTYLFVSAHLTNGKASSESNKRRGETTRLRDFVAGQKTVPMSRVILAGDFNSQRNRPDDTPRKVLETAGFHDVYDRSASFTYPKYNSYNGYKTTPTTSERYGDHVDRVFVQDAMGSTAWKVVQWFTRTNGKYRYATPIGSDHSPVRVTLYLP